VHELYTEIGEDNLKAACRVPSCWKRGASCCTERSHASTCSASQLAVSVQILLNTHQLEKEKNTSSKSISLCSHAMRKPSSHCDVCIASFCTHLCLAVRNYMLLFAIKACGMFVQDDDCLYDPRSAPSTLIGVTRAVKAIMMLHSRVMSSMSHTQWSQLQPSHHGF